MEKCRESHLRAFVGQIRQGARIRWWGGQPNSGNASILGAYGPPTLTHRIPVHGLWERKGIFAKAEEISSRQQFRKTGPTKRFGSDKLQGLLRSGILECQMLSAFTSHWIQFSPKVGCRFQIDQFMFGFPVKRKCAVNGNILWWLILIPICKCNTSMCAMCQEENVRTGNKVLKSGAKSTTKEGFAS